MFSRNGALKRDSARFVHDIADFILGKIQAFFLGQRRLQVSGAPDQPRLAFLAYAALEDGLDEDRAATLDQAVYLMLASFRPEYFGGRETGDLEQPGSVEHSTDIHSSINSLYKIPVVSRRKLFSKYKKQKIFEPRCLRVSLQPRMPLPRPWPCAVRSSGRT